MASETRLVGPLCGNERADYDARMADTLYPERRQREKLDRQGLVELQIWRLNELLDQILPANRFYAEKLDAIARPVRSLDVLTSWPFTTKQEFIDASQHRPPTNLTYPLDQYTRAHRTSGTRGTPLTVYDSAEDWNWWIETWQFVLDAAQVTASDRALMAFSFGPFVGFWSAYDALAHRGALVIPTGGMSTRSRLDLLMDQEATLVCCTPTYALRISEVAQELGMDLSTSSVRSVIVAGEPGGSLPAVRARIEHAWGARVVDHSGATEVGPWGYGDQAGRGLFVPESEFIVEVLPPLSHQDPPLEPDMGELVLTALGRTGWPVIRYRTGDLVRPQHHVEPHHEFVFLEGGILGRVDDMLVIRGVNVFPTAVEQIIRTIPEVDEFRMVISRDREMDELCVEVETANPDPEPIAEALHRHLGLRVEVRCVSPGVLPRFESKSNRILDQR